jgi:hypothetical protein
MSSPRPGLRAVEFNRPLGATASCSEGRLITDVEPNLNARIATYSVKIRIFYLSIGIDWKSVQLQIRCLRRKS